MIEPEDGPGNPGIWSQLVRSEGSPGDPQTSAGVGSEGSLVEDDGALYLAFDSRGPSEGFRVSTNKHTNSN